LTTRINLINLTIRTILPAFVPIREALEAREALASCAVWLAESAESPPPNRYS